jgi:hypothetical protein
MVVRNCFRRYACVACILVSRVFQGALGCVGLSEMHGIAGASQCMHFHLQCICCMQGCARSLLKRHVDMVGWRRLVDNVC